MAGGADDECKRCAVGRRFRSLERSQYLSPKYR